MNCQIVFERSGFSVQKIQLLKEIEIPLDYQIPVLDVNTFLTAWVEERHHCRRHSTLKMTPQDALAQAKAKHLDRSRYVESPAVHEAFLWRETREVSEVRCSEAVMLKVLGVEGSV